MNLMKYIEGEKSVKMVADPFEPLMENCITSVVGLLGFAVVSLLC